MLLALWLALPPAGASQAAPQVRYAVDFPYVQAVVPDSVAWLYQPGTGINQPVMFSADPAYYLRRQFGGRISSNGAVFVTGEEPPDFAAPLITLYGKNCMDFSLFGSLSRYREEAYYQAHPTFYLLTPQGDYRLDVFAGLRVKLADQESWRVTGSTGAALWEQDLPRLLEQSFLTPDPSLLPGRQDAWAVLATQALDTRGNRYVLYATKRPLAWDALRAAYVNQLEMDARPTSSGYVFLEDGRTWMRYAQNDPLWERLVFEARRSSRRRAFGDGGCGPTAVAMALANLVDKARLPTLGAFAASPLGFRFCTCSVNDLWCTGQHVPYQLTTPQEYLRYLPLAIASFATGNNQWGVQGRADRFGTSMRYLEDLCGIWNLSLTQTSDISEAIAFLQQGDAVAVACTGGPGSPFTQTSHFLTLAGAGEGYLYILDPLPRENYRALDPQGRLEVLEPGFVRVPLKAAAQCSLRPIYLLGQKPGP